MTDAGQVRPDLEKIFFEAIALPAAEQAAWLEDRLREAPEALAQLKWMIEIDRSEDHPLDIGLIAVDPDRIDRFEIVERIGEGGMGVVFKAFDPRLDRVVAIKVLSPALSRDPEGIGRFLREARLLAKVSHPHIADVYEVGPDDNWVAMELIEGPTVGETLENGPLPPTEALRLLIEVASGLVHAHENSVIHRDLKPQNILIDATKGAKIVDFGIAKHLASPQVSDGSGHGEPAPGTTTLGTLEYASPEQLRRESVDERTDVWSFGCVGYEILAGVPAFPSEGREAGRQPGTQAVELAEKRSDGPRWTNLPSSTPRALQNLLARCLEPEPGTRIATMSEVLEELQRILDQRSRATSPLRWLTILLLVVVLIATTIEIGRRQGFLQFFDDRPVPVYVTPDGNAVEVTYSDESTQRLLPPGFSSSTVSQADLLTPTLSDPAAPPWIVASTRPQEAPGPEDVFVWTSLEHDPIHLTATSDLPILGVENSYLYTDRWFDEVRVIDGTGPHLLLREYANLFVSVLRVFEVGSDGASLDETFRFYHEGHIGQAMIGEGFEPEQRLLWVSGVIRNGGIIRQTVGGPSNRVYFVGCMEYPEPGVVAYPYLEQLRPEFLSENPEVRRGDMLFYFTVNGYVIENGVLDWKQNDAIQIQRTPQPTVEGDLATISVLFSTSLTMTFRQSTPGEISVALSSTSDELSDYLERNPRETSNTSRSAIAHFLGDSVVTLCDVGDEFSVTGTFRRIDEKLPDPPSAARP